jgi:tetratricopeptide (TPR) repeat protein/ADP-heptose:LPS heptosyltransferase
MTKSIDQLLRKAQAFEKAEENVQAKEIYKHILSRFPKNNKALRGYAKLSKPPQVLVDNLISLFNSNRFQETVIAGRKLCEKFPEEPILYEILGAASLSLDNDVETLNYYKKLLQIQPKHTDALNNIGLVYYKLNLYDRAIEAYQKVVEFEPRFADAHYNLGNALGKFNQVRAACESYRKSLEIDPNDPEVLTNYGHALQRYGAFSEAVKYYEKAIEIDPSLSDVRASIEKVLEVKNTVERVIKDLLELEKYEPDAVPAIFTEAKVYETSGYNEAALDRYKLVSELDPNEKNAHLNTGMIHNRNCNYQPAIESFEKVIKIDPNISEAYFGLAKAQYEEGQLEAALENCKATNATRPDLEEVFDMMGTIQLALGDLDAALVSFKKVLTINPNSKRAHNNLGVAYYKLGDLDASIEAHKISVRVNPDSSLCHFNLASMFKHANDVNSAIECYDRAIQLEPDYVKAHWNLAVSHLYNKNFQEGWAKYEWRWKALPNMEFLQTYKQIWNGEKNKCVFLWAEQGIGDEIMFSSIIPELGVLCARLIIQVDDRLIPLFRRSFPNDIDFRPRTSRVPETEYDYHIPIGSLPRFFRQSAKDFEAISRGWLAASQFKTNELREKLTKDGSERIIGISWNSTKPREGAEHKVISLTQLAKKLHAPKTKLVNLQYGDVRNELLELKEKTNIEVAQLHEINNRDDIDGLASLIMACDKVVSISNATIHLAGALGKKSDVLIAFSGDWRWGDAQHSAYWYNSVRVCRQTSFDNWESSIEQL